jgi:hypothetical protein
MRFGRCSAAVNLHTDGIPRYDTAKRRFAVQPGYPTAAALWPAQVAAVSIYTVPNL